MQGLSWFSDALIAQRGTLFAWVPVCLGLGIAGYFALKIEPNAIIWLSLAIIVVVLLIAARLVPLATQPLMLGLALLLGGAGIAKWQTHSVSAPVLTFRYYGPIEGRVVNIDRSASDAVRLTLDDVFLSRIQPQKLPARVRISLHGDQPLATYRPGDRLMTTGHLSPPSGPAEPGGFDFQRHAYFAGLGAVGYTRNPVLRSDAARPGDWGLWIFTQRMRLSRAVQAAVPGEPGAFAAAIMTGDRSGMSRETLQNLRAANLAHLLAISGLHMGLLTGFVFAVIRYGLALIPWLALRVPIKKFAALCAIAVGAAYLGLSGGNVATERAFIMVTTMFVAILLDRRALTMRAVAMAAIVVLVLHPEALMGPGFQMSFAATTALVVVFGYMRNFDQSRLPKWMRPILSVVISSFVAGLATAPIAAAHFNQIAHYGLIANLLSVPLMGAVIMPAAVLAVCLAPLGLWAVGLWVMEQGLTWILWVAQTVATQDGALSHVVAPPGVVLGLLSVGLIWLIQWQGRARWLGLAAAASAFAIWGQVQRPAILIADSGGLVGRITPDGRDLSKPKGDGFVAGIWLENDGAPVPQEDAAARDGFTVTGRTARTELGQWQLLHISGKTALADTIGCGGADILISNQTITEPRGCLVLDATALRATGSITLDLDADGHLILTTARSISGNRPWNAHVPDEPQKIVVKMTKGPRDAAPFLQTAKR